jgi:hypothetical protein
MSAKSQIVDVIEQLAASEEAVSEDGVRGIFKIYELMCKKYGQSKAIVGGVVKVTAGVCKIAKGIVTIRDGALEGIAGIDAANDELMDDAEFNAAKEEVAIAFDPLHGIDAEEVKSDDDVN